MARIDPNQSQAPWDHTVIIRGVEVPLLSPVECDADECDHLPRGLIHLHRRVCASVRNWLFGERETDTLRRGIAMLLPEEMRHLVRDLTGGELLRLSAIYHGLQSEWLSSTVRRVHGAAFEQRGGAGMGSPSTNSGPKATGLRMRLAWGEPLPQALGLGSTWGANEREAKAS